MDKIEQPCFAPKMRNYDPEYIKFGFLMSSSDAELKVNHVKFHFVLFTWEDGPRICFNNQRWSLSYRLTTPGLENLIF